MNKLQVYKKYFETAKDDTHLVMHRGYALALVKMVEELNKTFESSMGTTKAWVDKFNELEKKYDQALTVIASKKIMEMQNNIATSLYELEILHKKVNPTEYSSIDSHFKRIIGILKGE